MAEETLKDKTARGLLWGALNSGLLQLFNLGFGIILGKLLSPSEYGMVGMVTIFSSIASTLQEGGFISALNKKKEVTQADYNAVFWFSALMGVGLYAIGFACAPLIARLFDEPELTALARYAFLGFVIAGLSIVPKAYMFRQLRVRESSSISICALVVSGCVGVAMAYFGWSYWGIATQGLIYVSILTVLSFWRTRWRPSLSLDLSPLRGMIGFSSKLILTNICNVCNANLFNFVLGVLYTKVEVGNFSQANKWNSMGNSTIAGMLAGIAQPLFTKVEDNSARQVTVFRKLLRFTAFLAFPAMFGLSIVSEELIVLAIDIKWLTSAHILQILCIGGAFVPICTLFSNYLVARGRSDIYLWCTVGLVVAQLAAVTVAAPWGMEVMFRLFVAVNVCWVVVWHWFVRREIALRLRDVVLDLAPYLLLAGSLCLVAFFAFAGMESRLLRFVVKIAFVGTLYLGILRAMGSVILRESIDFFLKKKGGKRA